MTRKYVINTNSRQVKLTLLGGITIIIIIKKRLRDPHNENMGFQVNK